jgi:signal transduction histidine kinase
MALMLTARENRQYFARRVEELEPRYASRKWSTQRRTTLESLLHNRSRSAEDRRQTRGAGCAAGSAAWFRARTDPAAADERARRRQTQEYQGELSNRFSCRRRWIAVEAGPARHGAAARSSAAHGVPASIAGNGQSDQQTEVVASIAQELRTPMTSIAGYTDLLLGESVGILGAMQRQFLQRVKANIARMEGMLSDLVQITVIDTGQIKLEAASIDVPELIKDAVMAASTLFREREQSIRLELADNLPKLHIDRESLQQILQHLLSMQPCVANAAKIVRAQVPVEMPDYMLFSVTDQGGGISPDDRQRAFHRMYRADHPLVEGLGETGVGLSIAKAWWKPRRPHLGR